MTTTQTAPVTATTTTNRLKFGIELDCSDPHTGYIIIWTQVGGEVIGEVYDPAGFPLDSIDTSDESAMLTCLSYTIQDLGGWTEIEEIAKSIHRNHTRQ